MSALGQNARSKSPSNSSQRRASIAPSQLEIGLPAEIVTRILLRLASRYQLADVLHFTSVNWGLFQSFGNWRNAALDGFRGKEPKLLADSEYKNGLVADMVKLFDHCEDTPDRTARPSAQLERYEDAALAENMLAYGTLCASLPGLFKSKSLKQVDLVLIGLQLSIAMGVESAMVQFDRLPHLKLVYYLRNRKAADFQHIDILPKGNFANFAPALAASLDGFPKQAGRQAAQWMIRLVESRGVSIQSIKADYIQLMNGVLKNLHKLDSGTAQAKVLNSWIEHFPQWALPRLHLLLSELVLEGAEIARIALASPHTKWRKNYEELQALLTQLLVSNWEKERDKCEEFLSAVAEKLALPPNYALDRDGLNAADPGFKQHANKMEAWHKKHSVQEAVLNAGFSITYANSDQEADQEKGGNCRAS